VIRKLQKGKEGGACEEKLRGLDIQESQLNDDRSRVLVDRKEKGLSEVPDPTFRSGEGLWRKV